MGQWHRVNVHRAHRGTGRHENETAFIYAEDISGVVERYKKMPGVKRKIRGRFPDISPLLPDESADLERRILRERIIPLSRARRTWYYNQRR